MILAAVFLLALLPRAIYLLWSPPAFSGEYWDLSSALLERGTLALDGFTTTRFEPLYPLFLALARSLTGGSETAVQWLQIAVSSLGAPWLYLAATTLTRRARIGWLAAALYAFDPLLVRHAAAHSDSALITALLILFAYLFARATTPGRAAAAGAALGLAILTRAVALPVALLAAGVLLTRRAGALAAALVVASLVVASPMLIRDYRLSGSLLPAREGVNLFVGNSPYSAALLPDHSPDLLQRYADQVAARELPDLTPGTREFSDEAGRVLSRLAWAEMLGHPMATMALKARNVWYFFSPQLVPSHLLTPDTSVVLGPEGRVTVTNGPLRPVGERLVFGARSLLVLASALVGLVVRRRELRSDGGLWVVLLTFVAVHSLYFPATRYGAPVAFVLLFYSAVGLDRGLTAITRG